MNSLCGNSVEPMAYHMLKVHTIKSNVSVMTRKLTSRPGTVLPFLAFMQFLKKSNVSSKNGDFSQPLIMNYFCKMRHVYQDISGQVSTTQNLVNHG